MAAVAERQTRTHTDALTDALDLPRAVGQRSLKAVAQSVVDDLDLTGALDADAPVVTVGVLDARSDGARAGARVIHDGAAVLGAGVPVVTRGLVDLPVAVVVEPVAGLLRRLGCRAGAQALFGACANPLARALLVLHVAGRAQRGVDGQLRARAFPLRSHALVAGRPREGLGLLACVSGGAGGVEAAGPATKMCSVTVFHAGVGGLAGARAGVGAGKAEVTELREADVLPIAPRADQGAGPALWASLVAGLRADLVSEVHGADP